MKCAANIALAAGLSVASAARADFVIVGSQNPITSGPYSGDSMTTFTIQNSGLGATAGTSRLVALDVTMRALGSNGEGHLLIHTLDYEDSGTKDDADFSNLGQNPQPLSYIRFGSIYQWTLVTTSPPFSSPDDDANFKSNTPYTDGQALAQFEVAGFVPNGLDDRSPMPFAAAVVPEGEFVELSGLAGAESGQPQSIMYVPPVPEPAHLSTVAAIAAACRLRRRSA